MSENNDETTQLSNERSGILKTLEDWLETPLLILGFVWLALLIIELTGKFSPILETFGTIIWIIFIIDFVIKFTLAPHKIGYLKSNWLTAIALVIPALRIFRIFRVMQVLRFTRFARGIRLVRVVTSLNRGMKSLSESFGRRGFGYVIALTMIVLFAGAAGMYAFENESEGGLKTYGESLWWTAMLLTSIGSDYFPRTAEGRVLCLLLALYGFCIFGYVTATLATFFIEREAESEDSSVADAKSLDSLQNEVNSLRQEIRALSERLRI